MKRLHFEQFFIFFDIFSLLIKKVRGRRLKYPNDPAVVLARKGNEGRKWKVPHTCCICQKVLKCRAGLRSHLNVFHVKTKKWYCDLCPKVYFLKNAIAEHMRGVHSKEKFPSAIRTRNVRRGRPKNPDDPVCAMALKGNEGLRSSEPHTCCFCQKVMRSREILRNHLNIIHLQMNKWYCDHCPKFYFMKSTLVDHMQAVHSKEKFTCKICNQQYTSLKHHTQEHRRVQCVICGRMVFRSNRKKHARRHGLNNFDKCFEIKQDLKQNKNLNENSLLKSEGGM